ncbi:hypothetical protein GALMADRAFT_229291 [Galerina marginata CBS 339.88]|uniref:Uncharacterized protein n=1 Tax=Galerina marginata (strain CBS 339.88) TaxID=685588 RepID=A0A067SLC1_GALM3|nr:hypothetical protein GALMADRAFT_229291 [Galerina marginata CBS 339.88]
MDDLKPLLFLLSGFQYELVITLTTSWPILEDDCKKFFKYATSRNEVPIAQELQGFLYPACRRNINNRAFLSGFRTIRCPHLENW